MTGEKPDYTNSAENLCNPVEVADLIAQYRNKLSVLDATKAKIPVDIMNQCMEAEAEVKRVYDEIKEAIDQYGSFQDIELGYYAIKYRRMKKSYCVEAFKELFPKYVSAVVEETINVKALEGMVKGKLINEEELTAKVAPLYRHPVISQETQYAFFIR